MRAEKKTFREMPYDNCVENHQNNVRVSDSTEDEAADRSKRGMIKKKANSKSFEIGEVENLSSHITSVSRNSGIIEKLYEKRKLRHEELIRQLANNLNDVNLKVEENIRISSEGVKAQMKEYRDELRDKLKCLDSPQVASYHESVFLEIQKEANEMKSHQLRLVHELYDDLRKFENFRSAENERIFQLSFKEIEKTAYVLPYELQSIVEHEALKINQLALNNRRCYEDLKLKLTLVTEQTFKSFMDEIFCLREKWIRYNMQQATDGRQCEDERSPIPPEPQTRLELKSNFLSLTLTTDKCFNIAEEEDWLRNVNDVSSYIEATRKVLIDLYQQVIRAVQKDMTSGEDELRKSLLCMDVLQFEERTIEPILFRSGGSAEDFRQLELYWQSILRDVRSRLQDACDCLEQFGELWSRHVDRLCESKIVVMKAVEKAGENSVLLLQDLEIKGNLNLDALRQEYNEGRMDALYAATVANLDAIRERLESDYANEVTITEDYHKMMNLEADILSSEIKEFICLKMSEMTEFEDGSLAAEPDFKRGGTNSVQLFKKLKEIRSEMTSFKLLKSQLRKSLENFADGTRERTALRAEEWVSNRVKEISRRYQTQLEMHHKRYDRIRIHTYEVRRQEIYVHEKVFQDHKAGVEDFYRKLTLTTEKFYENFLEKLENGRTAAASTVADAKKEDRAASVRCTQTQIQKQKAEFMTEVTMKAEQIQQEIEFRAFSVQQSTLKFMKSIKLFHENGNYDADEAKSYVTSLEVIDRECGNEVKSAIREVRKKETEILQKASDIFDGAIRTLMQLDEELQFHESVKNIVNLCRNDLQESFARFSADFDSLNRYLNSMRICIADEENFLTQEEDGFWVLLVTSVYKNIPNLFYPLKVPHWLESTWAAEGDESERKSVQGSQGGKGKDSKSDFSSRDFREEIFDASLLTDSTPAFLIVLCKKCSDYMDHLQRSGYAFYENMGSKSLIREDLLKSNYEEFYLDIYQLFRSFALRGETVWLQMIHGFLPVLGSVKISLKTYFGRRVREYGENVLSVLKNFEDEFENCFSRNSCQVLYELQCLDDKLLSLHGHPRNGHLLLALEDEVVEKTAELELAWEIFMKSFYIKLKSLRKMCTSENEDYQTLKLLYEECKNSIFVEELGEDLLNAADAVVDRGGFIKRRMTWRGSTDRKSLLPYVAITEVEASPTMKPSMPHHPEGRPEDADEYLAEIKKMIRRETAILPLDLNKTIDMDKEDWMNLLEPKLGLLQDAEEFDDLTSIQMKRIKIAYREIRERLQSKTNFHREILFEWLDRWKRNLRQNSELFTVKYPDLGEP